MLVGDIPIHYEVTERNRAKKLAAIHGGGLVTAGWILNETFEREQLNSSLQWRREPKNWFIDTTRSQLVLETDAETDYLPRDEFFDKLLDVLPWVQPSNANEINAHWFSNFPMCSETFEGVHHVIAALKTKGISMGIVTNGKGNVQNEKIDVIGVRRYMSPVIVSGDVNIRKPDKRIFN